ncbi:MAG: energy transducer TonB [Vicinamibacteraceae bacterium]|nr:energy transducer TonB [Vicinamibacteraceae bacterium]
MHDAVSHALVARGRPPRGFDRMLGASLAAHAVLIAALALGPRPATTVEPDEREVMTISLGGAPGPRAGGMTALGGRPVQAVAPPAAKPEPAQAPAERQPAMVEPTRAAPKPKPTPPETVAAPVEQSPGRTPTKGAEVRPGSALAFTGGQGIGVGLSTGGGGTGGEISLGDFCCPDYLQAMLAAVQQNWNSRQQVAGRTTIKFTVVRDGRITNVEVARPSGFAVLDFTAQRAVMAARLPPLPAAYTNPSLTIHLTFEYQR